MGLGEPLTESGRTKEDTRAALLEATAVSAVLTDDAKKKYEQTMLTKYPGYGFTLTVVFSADALARELIRVKNHDW